MTQKGHEEFGRGAPAMPPIEASRCHRCLHPVRTQINEQFLGSHCMDLLAQHGHAIEPDVLGQGRKGDWRGAKAAS